MDKQAILDKQQEVASEFDKLKQEGESHRNLVTEIEDNLKKLQGKWQAYEELIKNWVETPLKKAK